MMPIDMRTLLRKMVPATLRRSRAAALVRNEMSRRGWGHDWFYSAEYFAHTVEAAAVESSADIAQSIVADFAPRSVVDVGCGTGALLDSIRRHGCDVFGYEYSKAAIEYCRKRDLPVEKFDVERDQRAGPRRFDVAVSMEVAEHLPASAAERYVAMLAGLAPVVVFTAATPGQGGNDHVNEQPHKYWIEKFAAHGLALDRDTSRRWGADWQRGGRVRDWYYRNLMVFRAAQ